MGGQVGVEPQARWWQWTDVAGFLAAAWSLVVAGCGALVIVLAPVIENTQDDYCGNIDHAEPCANVLPETMGGGLVALLAGIWGLVATVALLKRRRWAGRAVVVTFALWTVTAVVGMAVTARSDGGLDLAAAAIWVALITLFVLIVALAAGVGADRRTRLTPG
jgi:hypothetical protein